MARERLQAVDMKALNDVAASQHVFEALRVASWRFLSRN
jgi:hypothetical protein